LRFLFIVIPSRSGSTLCSSIIDTSDQVLFQAGQNESYEFFHKMRNLGEMPKTWLTHFDNWENEYWDINNWDSSFNALFSNRSGPRLNYEKIYKEFKTSKNKIICDKFPFYLRRWRELEKYFSQYGEVSFIGSIRDPRYTKQSWKVRPARQTSDPFTCSWDDFTECNIDFLENCKNRYFYRYEDLIKNPKEIINDIQDFLKIKINIEGKLIGKKNTGKLGKLENYNLPKWRYDYPFDKVLANKFGYYPSFI
jgi:hypothetical protein